MLRLAYAVLLIVTVLAVPGCYRSPSHWDSSPSHVLLRAEEFRAETKLDAWFTTPHFALYGDGTVIEPHLRSGKLAWTKLTPERTASFLEYIEGEAGFLDLEPIDTPEEPGKGDHGWPVWRLELGLPDRAETTWQSGAVAGCVTALTDEFQDMLLALPWEICEARSVRYAVGEVTSDTGDEYSGTVIAPPKPPEWPLTASGETLADLAKETQKGIAAGHKDGEWLSIPQIGGAVAQAIISGSENDFEFPIVYQEGEKLYWLRWAPVVENPNAIGGGEQ